MSDLLLRFGQNFQQTSENCKIFAWEVFWGKTDVLKKNSQYFFRTASEAFLAGLLKNFPTFLEEIFPRKNFSFKKIMSLSCLWRCFFPDIRSKRFGKVFKTAFRCPEEHVSWKKLLLRKVHFLFKIGHGAKFFESLPETFLRLSEKCNLCVHRNILKNKFSLFDINLFFLV